jgi:hypothetical protein
VGRGERGKDGKIEGTERARRVRERAGSRDGKRVREDREGEREREQGEREKEDREGERERKREE